MKDFGDNKKSKKKIIKNIKPNNLKAQIISKAFTFHAKGDISQAIKQYKYFINQGFADTQVFSNYGVLLKELGKITEAELFIRKAIELNPKFAMNHSNLGVILTDLGKLEEAEASFRKAIELNPKFADAYLNLAGVLRDLGKLEEFILISKSIIEKKFFNKGYKLNDLIGRTGIEYVYEDFIRGEWGGEMVEVNSLGKFQRSLGMRPPVQGDDIELTIDLNLQLVAEEVLKDKKAGAIIVMDPRDGAIRAMTSKPTFDLNFFSKDFKSEKEYNKLFNSPEKPLFNRALNAYDPGSVWKIVTALAGLESGKFPKETMLDTKPCITYGSQCFREHNDLGFGVIGYEDALRVSSNTFFYQVGYGVGVDEIYKVSRKLGFNSLSGVEISEQENIGLVASSEWAKKGRGWGQPGRTPWVPEDIASMSIGQFVVQVTPIQIAKAYAAIANGGYLVTPYLVKKDEENLSDKKLIKIDVDSNNIQLIKSGLRIVVESGTGVSIIYELTNLPPVSGKTGTAEDGEGGSDHAWFVCFTPSEKSELLVVAFAQNTPGGGAVHALPMAREILKVWNEKE